VSRRDAVGKDNEATRDAWVRAALAALPAGGRILDAGAGEQRYRDACAHLEYVAQDFGRYEGSGDGTGLQTQTWDTSKVDIVCDIAEIPEDNASFDAVLCTEVLEHVPDPLGSLMELSRLLRRGGTLLVTVPFCSLTHFAPWFFYTGFSRHFFETHLPPLRLDVKEITPNGSWFEWMAQEIRRTRWVAETHAGGGPGWWDRRALRRALKALGRLAARDQGSSELLCYGLHVRAVKR
jgi:SAM-dependent methyltransferase